jgi:hypothetical protein
MVRVCKPGGSILLLERGCSYLSVYNEWLKFKAARDLCEQGTVEHLDIEKLVNNYFLKDDQCEIVHEERKNWGMTYIYILRKRDPENDPKKEPEENELELEKESEKEQEVEKESAKESD